MTDKRLRRFLPIITLDKLKFYNEKNNPDFNKHKSRVILLGALA